MTSRKAGANSIVFGRGGCRVAVACRQSLEASVYYLLNLILSIADCPGTESEQAGKSSACEGCPNQQICATAPKGPDPGKY